MIPLTNCGLHKEQITCLLSLQWTKTKIGQKLNQRGSNRLQKTPHGQKGGGGGQDQRSVLAFFKIYQPIQGTHVQKTVEERKSRRGQEL